MFFFQLFNKNKNQNFRNQFETCSVHKNAKKTSRMFKSFGDNLKQILKLRI